MKKITIKDIAKMAGVNHSTVSRSLNDSPRVAKKTKQRIKQIAKEVGFEYNYSARALSSKKTGSIGLIFPNDFNDVSTGTFMVDFMANIHRTLEKNSYNIIFDFTNNIYTNESNIKTILLRKKVDGLLIMAANQMSESDLNFIKESKIPCVILHNRYKDSIDIPDISNVFIDHFKGGYLATKYLIDTGHKKILTYTYGHKEDSSKEFELRTLGYKKAIEENELKEFIFKGKIDFNDGDTFINKNFEFIKSCDAIFAQTDILAISMIQALREKGINVPEDLSIIGYDDISMSTYLRPYLTTIHQPAEKAAEIACQNILKLLKEKKNEKIHLLVEPKLIIRDSTKIRK